MKIHKTTDPILRTECKKVTEFDFELQQLIDEMIEIMRKKRGIGLAAPQVGVAKQVFVCEFPGDKENGIPEVPLSVFCNPQITWQSPKQKLMVEGCLSFPGLEMAVKRPKEVIIKAQDRHGNPFEIKADDIYARVIQHEYDHLNSTLMIDRAEKYRVIFIGTGNLGAKALEALTRDAQYEILLVITGEEKTVVSRKKAEQNPIFQLAKKSKLPVLRTTKINDEKIIQKIKALKPNIGVMADFGQMVPKTILDIFKLGVLNIHPSLLPLHRGPSPIQSTILEGDKLAGVTIMLTSSEMDAGPIISQGRVQLTGNETASILKDYLGEFGANLLLNSIPYYVSGELIPEEQNEIKATFSQIIQKKDGEVDLNTPANIVDRKIRAFDQWPKAWIKINDKRVQLISGHFEEDGTFLLDLVKPEGKNIMNYEDFLRGYRTKIEFK